MIQHFPDPRAAAFAFTAREEGGYKAAGKLGDNNAAYKGINQSTYDRWRTKRALPTQDVQLASDAEVAAIYAVYWQGFLCQPIADAGFGALALCHFDCEFNGGGTQVLEETIGEIMPGQRATTLTQAEVDALIATCQGESGETGAVAAYLQNRLDRFRDLKNPEALPTWEIRLNQLAMFVGISWRVS